MKISIAAHQIQRQYLTPAMKMSIETLLLPLAELNTAIEQELQNNPLLEVDEKALTSIRTPPRDEILKALEYSNQTPNFPFPEHSADDDTAEGRPIKSEICLEDELLQQLRVELSDPLEIKIGELIIGSLDEDGYLTATCEEIARLAGTGDIVLVEYILKIIQHFEPAGIASRNLRECLLFQAKRNGTGIDKLAYKIIENHLEELGGKKFSGIAKKLGVSPHAVKKAARLIALLEPKPARNHRPLQANLYVKADVSVTKDENGLYHIHMNREGAIPLRINSHYQKMLSRPDLKDEEKNFIREKLKNAVLFIKSIEQRGRTIRRITERLVERQKDFFENGRTALTPMTLKDMARMTDRNESTISRAIQNKYIDTPQGLFPFKFFFSPGIPENENGRVASRSVKEEIKELIKSENKASPLSDQAIQNHFRGKGVNLARRTVSKYRQSMRILPSHLRRL